MALYILIENSSSYFIETRSKQEVSGIKSLNQKRVPTIAFENIEDIPEIFTDSKAVMLLTQGINEKNKKYVEICNQRNIPVISLHNKNNLHHSLIFSSITDNDDITASMIYSYFKTNQKDNVAFFGLYPGAKSDISKLNAFYCVNQSFDYDDVFLVNKGFENCMSEFWEHRYDYDAVYFPNDFVAIAFLKYFMENEPSYLEERFFLGSSNTIISRLFHIGLSSVTYTLDAVKAAVLHIYRSLTNNKDDFKCISIDLNNVIIPRESTQKKTIGSNGFFTINERRNTVMKYDFGEKYDHKSDPALKDYFVLENFLLNLKTIDLLIIYMFLKGYTNSMITHKLFLAQQSLNSHKNNYLRMTGCADRNEFIDFVSKYVSLKHLEEYIQYVSNDITDFSKY